MLESDENMSIKAKGSSTRNYGVDAVKILAAILVLSVHYMRASGFYDRKLEGEIMFGSVMMFGLFMTCVPLFCISSGMVLRNRKISESHYSKIIPFIIRYAILQVITAYLFKYVSEQPVTAAQYKSILFSTPYFISMYIQIYFLSPFLNVMYNNLEENKSKFILIAVLIFIYCLPSLLRLSGYNILYNGWQSSYVLMYYIVGLFLADMKFKVRPIISFLAGIVTMICYAALIFIFANHGKGVFSHYLGHSEGLFTLVLSILIVIFFDNLNYTNNKINFILKEVSSITIGNYIIGGYFTERLAWSIFVDKSNYLVSLARLPLSVLFSFTIAGIITYIVFKFSDYVEGYFRNKRI